jgi:DhnA family fructose-bisphosphate aldolase class Ia
MAAREGRVATPFDGEVIAMNTRIAVEMGADVIKTDWPADAADFHQVVRGAAQAPILVAGGARLATDLDTLALVRDLLSAGACGIMFGRALFQSPQPLALMKAVRAMVHENLAYEDAAARLSTEPQLPQRRSRRGTSSMTS